VGGALCRDPRSFLVPKLRLGNALVSEALLRQRRCSRRHSRRDNSASCDSVRSWSFSEDRIAKLELGNEEQVASPILTAPRGCQFRFQFLLALVQALETKLPTMQLDAELVDVAGDLGALRFVLLQLMLEIGNFHGIFGSRFDRDLRNRRRLTAPLAIQRDSGRGRIDYKRSGAIRAGEDDIAARRLHGSSRAAHWLHPALN
jgi:hypothetical protein